MINPKNKRVQVTLSPESVELLDSLSNRYNKSYSEIVKWALNILGAKKKHNLTIMLRENNQEIQEEPGTTESLEEAFKDDPELLKRFKNW